MLRIAKIRYENLQAYIQYERNDDRERNSYQIEYDAGVIKWYRYLRSMVQSNGKNVLDTKCWISAATKASENKEKKFLKTEIWIFN